MGTLLIVSFTSISSKTDLLSLARTGNRPSVGLANNNRYSARAQSEEEAAAGEEEEVGGAAPCGGECAASAVRHDLHSGGAARGFCRGSRDARGDNPEEPSGVREGSGGLQRKGREGGNFPARLPAFPSWTTAAADGGDGGERGWLCGWAASAWQRRRGRGRP